MQDDIYSKNAPNPQRDEEVKNKTRSVALNLSVIGLALSVFGIGLFFGIAGLALGLADKTTTRLTRKYSVAIGIAAVVASLIFIALTAVGLYFLLRTNPNARI